MYDETCKRSFYLLQLISAIEKTPALYKKHEFYVINDAKQPKLIDDCGVYTFNYVKYKFKKDLTIFNYN